MYNELEQLKLVQSDVIEVKPYFAYGQLKLAYNSTDLQNALSIPKNGYTMYTPGSEPLENFIADMKFNESRKFYTIDILEEYFIIKLVVKEKFKTTIKTILQLKYYTPVTQLRGGGNI